MDKEPFYIFKTFFLITLGLLGPVLLVFSIYSYRPGIVGVLLGWSGMQIYLFFLLKAVSAYAYASSYPSKRRIQPERAAFFRILFLLVFLVLGGPGRDMARFIWTLGAAFSVYLCWLAFLVYYFYKRT